MYSQMQQGNALGVIWFYQTGRRPMNCIALCYEYETRHAFMCDSVVTHHSKRHGCRELGVCTHVTTASKMRGPTHFAKNCIFRVAK